MKRILVLVIMLVALTAFMFAETPQPFGLRYGMTMEQLTSIDPEIMHINEDLFLMQTVPNPHNDVEMYGVRVHKDRGLYFIRIVFRAKPSNDYGDELKKQFNEMKSVLIRQYGQPKHEFDFVRSGALWDDAQYFMRAIREGQRYLAAYWGTEDGSDMVAGDLKQIQLTTGARREGTRWSGTVTATYLFRGFQKNLEDSKEVPAF